MAGWQKPILEKVEFAACLRSLPEILKDDGKRSDGPSFLNFTTEAREDLGKTLLWVDAEMEFSNGKVLKFKGISFFLRMKGMEADIRKLPGADGFRFPDEDKPAIQKTLAITRIRIFSAAFK